MPDVAPTPEELRAEAYQRQVIRREANRRAAEARLHGNPVARRLLQIGWNPILRAREERGLTAPDDPEWP